METKLYYSMWQGMIWTERGTWLQTVDRNGLVRLSDCGVLSLTSVEQFCAERGIKLEVRASAQTSPMRATQFRTIEKEQFRGQGCEA
jgi:hypothetical protein